MSKYVCSVCGYVHEGDQPPKECPHCKAPGSKFVEQGPEMSWAAEHVVGVAQGAPEDLLAAVSYTPLPHQGLPLPGAHLAVGRPAEELRHGREGLEFRRRKGLVQFGGVEPAQLIQGQVTQLHPQPAPWEKVRVRRRASSVGSV